MKKIVYILSIVCMGLITSSCYDRDIIDHKEGVSLPAVTNLQSNLVNEKELTVSWQVPTSEIPDEMIRPLSVYIQIYKGNAREYQITLPNEPTTWTYTLKDPTSKYRVIVKLYGKLDEALYGMTSEIYSLGQTVEVN